MATLTADSLLGCTSIPGFFQGTADGSNPTKMVFHNISAPTSWTRDTTDNNKALRVIGGPTATALSPGGSNPFTTVFNSSQKIKTGGVNSVSISGSSPGGTVTFTTPSTGDVTYGPQSTATSPVTLSTAQIGPHLHGVINVAQGSLANGNTIAPANVRPIDTTTTGTTADRQVPGGGAGPTEHSHAVTFPHTHTFSSPSHTHTLSSPSHAHNILVSPGPAFDILYVDVMIVTKD
jgi:hypothetical protein